MANSYKLTYFNIPGRAEVSRLLFTLARVQFQDNRVEFASWLALKPTMPLGQMPVLEHNGKVYCQSEAIARFLARKFGFYGNDELEGLQIDQILGAVSDVYSVYVQIQYVLQDEEKVKRGEKLATEDLPRLIAFLEKQLGGEQFFIGNKVSLADLVVYDFLGGKVPEVIAGWRSESKAINELIARVGDIEEIKEYVVRRQS